MTAKPQDFFDNPNIADETKLQGAAVFALMHADKFEWEPRKDVVMEACKLFGDIQVLKVIQVLFENADSPEDFVAGARTFYNMVAERQQKHSVHLANLMDLAKVPAKKETNND